MRSRLAFALFTSTLLAACAGGGSHDGGSDGPAGDMRLPDGSGPAPACGSGGGPCCTGRTCETGMRCGRGDMCCIPSGPGGAICHTTADCCTGLSCMGGQCTAPTGSGCTGSADCAMGMICTGGRCTMPAPGAMCGADGQMCCAGFTCNSGLACHSGMCSHCGDMGEPCCDGATGCAGLTLLCMGGMCTAPMMCGNAGQPCCAPGNTCSGALACMGGTCGMDPATGGMGEPCGPHSECGDGLVCNPAMRMCVMAPSDCGTDMQMCCTSEVSSTTGTCSGSLHCSGGACGMCTGPSLSCVLGGILPGQQCCNGSTCQLGLSGLRCCQGDGSMCTTDLDCCGFSRCMGGMCHGAGMGSICLTDSDCGMGLTCQHFQCMTAPPMCADVAASCSDTGSPMCCTGYSCRSYTFGGPTHCCSEEMGSCQTSADCCGQMLCMDNTCQCQARGSTCVSDDDCCDTDICIVGTCVANDGCSRVGDTCTTAGGECCLGLACSQNTAGDLNCCARDSEPCATNADCCGQMLCQNDMPADGGTAMGPHCQCRNTGESCSSSLDCCGASTCDTMSMTCT